MAFMGILILAHTHAKQFTKLLRICERKKYFSKKSHILYFGTIFASSRNDCNLITKNRMNNRFSPRISQVMAQSRQEAMRLESNIISTTHLMLGILRTGVLPQVVKDVLHQHFADIKTLQDNLEKTCQPIQLDIPIADDELAFDQEASRILKLSVLEARNLKSESVEPAHLLLAIMREGNNKVCELMKMSGLTYTELGDALQPHTDAQDGFGFADEEDDEDDHLAMGSKPEESRLSPSKKTESATPVIDNFGMDLTKAAADGLLDPVIGRDNEINRVAQILSRRKKNNPVLIGEPGVGKSAIVEGLALRINEHKIARILWNKRVVMLDMGSVVAGTKYRGQFEERIRAIVSELQKHPEVIVFIDEIHTLVGAGSAPGTMDAANMLKPALARGEIQCIGATTLDEYRKSIEKDGALERRFQKVIVNPTTSAETLQILHNLKDRYEEHHQVHYTDDALAACVRLTERYITDRCFPDKAIDAMDEAGSHMHIQDVPVSDEVTNKEKLLNELKEKKIKAINSQNFELAAEYRDQERQAEAELLKAKQAWEASLKDNYTEVNAQHIASVVAGMTGIPVQQIGQEENTRLRNLNNVLSSSVIGQPEAVSQIARSIQRSRLGLKDPNKPIGTFLFVGPTGVGKTYLAKKLAQEVFGSQDALIRIDMSEYGEKHTVSRMMGAPPGYVGYDEGGQLTEKVRRRPYSVVLLDELEKAHSDVFNVLLQVMDEGRLTDGNGVTIDFKNTIIIMTSNCGTRQIKEFGQGVGFGTVDNGTKDKEMARSLVRKQLQKQFAPEFLNRLDDVVYFDQLDKDAISAIVDIELRPLLLRVAEMGYTLNVTDDAKQLLSDKGYDVQYGARPLKRAIQTYIEDPLCDLLMSDEAPIPGEQLTTIINDDKIQIQKI